MLTKSDAGQRLGCRRGVALALTCFGVAAGIRAYKPFQPQGEGIEMAEATSREKKEDAATDEFNALTPCYRCNEIYKAFAAASNLTPKVASPILFRSATRAGWMR